MSEYSCPRCQGVAIMAGCFGQSGVREDGTPFRVDLGTSYRCAKQHQWEFNLKGDLKVIPDPPPTPEYVETPIPVFDEWSRLNQVSCDGRSRFNVLREELPKCKTKAEVKRWLVREEFDGRYPILPESLPD